MNRNIGSHAVYEKCVDIIEEDVCHGSETLHSKLPRCWYYGRPLDTWCWCHTYSGIKTKPRLPGNSEPLRSRDC